MANFQTVALVGSDSLLGRELRDLFPESGIQGQLSLVASGDEEAGLLTRLEDEPAVVHPLESAFLSQARLVFLAGSPESSRHVVNMRVGTQIIDLTYGAEDAPHARLRAPLVEPPDFEAPAIPLNIVAHPAAVTIAIIAWPNSRTLRSTAQRSARLRTGQ